MYNRAELKNRSKQQLKGNVLVLFFMILTVSLVSTILSNFIPVIGVVLGFILTSALSIGVYRNILGVTRNNIPDFTTIIPESAVWGKSSIMYLLIGLYTTLWSLLLFIPGIIKGYSYSMSSYILAENSHMSASEAITESRRIMNGHKWELFVLDLSFIGWALLIPFTLGLLTIYVAPYYAVAHTNFYRELTDGMYQKDSIEDIFSREEY